MNRAVRTVTCYLGMDLRQVGLGTLNTEYLHFFLASGGKAFGWGRGHGVLSQQYLSASAQPLLKPSGIFCVRVVFLPGLDDFMSQKAECSPSQTS